ncbi:MAG: PilX N-terminal domain-containing pilus assembly protein [Pseudomonadota bacterium]
MMKTTTRRIQSVSAQRQRGAVLLVSLVILLLITLVSFSIMETSNLEAKMATAMEQKEITFQMAEAVIEEATDDFGYLGEAYREYLKDPNSPLWPDDKTHALVGYDTGSRTVSAAGKSEMRYLTNAPTEGFSMRKGAAGLDTFYYEVEATATVNNTNISNVHTQGVYVLAPRID